MDGVKKQETYETDWLASKPVYYNTKNNKVSNNINDVIEYRSLEIHKEGLNNYLDFGYSVFGQTPIKNVKFLGHSEKLVLTNNGNLKKVSKEDKFRNWIDKSVSEKRVIEKIKSKVRSWEENEEIAVIPMSGGFDSRILSVLTERRENLKAFTYGLSEDQSNSEEVIYAKLLSDRLNIDWSQVKLGDFHKYFEEWYSIYGPSIHSHGMYQMEFYKKVNKQIDTNNSIPLLSGIIGDVWAGGVKVPEIKSPSDVYKLGYTHGLRSSSEYSNYEDDGKLRREYFETHRDLLENPRFRIVEAMRRKIILLSYLFAVPRQFSFAPWSPFLDVDVAGMMLAIPDHRRENREWQRDFFRDNNVYFEEMDIDASSQNNLNAQAMRRIPPRPLDSEILSRIVQPNYVRWINRTVGKQGALWDSLFGLLDIPKLGGVLRRVGLEDQRLDAYQAYLTLRPLEMLLKRCQARRNHI
ncbi:asparagine synthase-related protein [Salinibacter ruber]|uniref:asparagine synthase-related protein n=1 Tax=Salinibacter ruber TaxID=146919 RepID=UPI0021681457|nr:asparagine synthase-related protein [Salinibacter ruber]MCS3824362.1 hypothetical protein [Salinibacter ruber]